MTVIERRKYTATGGNSATLPTLLPGLGVAGVAHRWSSSMLGTIGQPVSNWTAYTGGVALAQSTVAAQPIAGTGPNGTKVLRTDGVDDVITAGSQLTNAKTVTFLLRVLDPAGTTEGAVAWDGGYLMRGSQGGSSSTRIGATALSQPESLDQPKFHVVTVINDFAGGVGATVVDGNYGAQATDRENTNVSIGRASTNYGRVEVLEVAVWKRALSQTECQTVRTALQSAYPGLVA